MKLICGAAVCAVLLLGIDGCSSQNQERAKEEAREEARKASNEAKKAGREVKEEAKELSQRVSAAVKPDGETASDKLSRAGVKLDHAAILAKVKTNLASNAGLSTLTNVIVEEAGGVVTLSGTVATLEQKKSAEAAALEIEGVIRVHNNLTVQQ